MPKIVSKPLLLVLVILVTVLLGLGLFLPLGTFFWLEAWIYLSIVFTFFMVVIF